LYKEGERILNRWTDQKKGVKTSTRSSVKRNGGEVIEKSINKEKPIGNYFIYPGEVLSIPPALKIGLSGRIDYTVSS
jgi:hypothetical protein